MSAPPGTEPAGPTLATRAGWVALLARLTDGFVRSIPDGGSPAGAGLPGARPGDQVPSIEGFARMSVAWSAWLHEPSNPSTVRWRGSDHDVAELLARGLADATDPSHPAWWGPIGDRDQRIVEASEIATAVWLGRARLRAALDRVDPMAFGRVLDWLTLVDGKDLWPDNWVLFPVVPALVRRAAGRSVDHGALDAALDWMVAHTVGDGWTSDGAGHALDLYSGWAIHWHLLWWAAIDGDRRPRLAADVRRRSRAWLRFAAALVDEGGAFPRFGRSLGYRFAIAAPFGQAALLGIDPLPPGLARTLAGRLIAHSLDEGAIDPATDWFRVGVGGVAPEVVEGYVSPGASAWAAHALVALALPARDSFWRAPAGVAHPFARGGRAALVPAAAAGFLGARTVGSTALHNARTGHPSDIADHDYAATYGKLAYRSAFPFDVPIAGGTSAGSDDALVALEPEADPVDRRGGRLAHRNESLGGSAGPGWISSRYVLPTRRPTTVHTVVLVVDGMEIRIHRVAPGTPIRLRDGGAALGTAGDQTPDVAIDPDGRLATVRSGERQVSIRALLGFDVAGTAEPGPGRRNLVHDRSIHPWVEEPEASDRPRLVASATVAAVTAGGRAARAGDPAARLRDVDLTRTDDAVVSVVIGTGRSRVVADVDLGTRPRRVVGREGREIRGPGIRVALIGRGGSAIAGERIESVAGILTLARPGIVAVSRTGGSVEATVESGIALDPDWAGPGLDVVRVADGVGTYGPPVALTRAGTVPDTLIRRSARQLASRLVTIRFDRR